MRTIEEILDEFIKLRLEEAEVLARRDAKYLESSLRNAVNRGENLEEAYLEWLFD